MTAPLTPPDCDLTDFASMFFDVRRLLTSETWIEAAETPRLGHALMCLWMESWHQRPAASLPDNDAVLARLAMCDMRTWKRLHEKAMQGWILCDDGRWYHPVVAEKALEAWERKVSYRDRTAAARAAKQAKSGRSTGNDKAPVTEADTGSVTEPETASLTALKGRGRGRGTDSEAIASAATPPVSPPHDPDALAWSEGKRLLTERGGMKPDAAGRFFGKLLREHDLQARDLVGAVADAWASGTLDPQGLLTGAAKARGRRRATPANTPDLGYC